MSAAQFQAQRDAVLAAGLDAVLYDQLGCGQSAKPRLPATVYHPDELTADLHAVLEAYAKARTNGPVLSTRCQNLRRAAFLVLIRLVCVTASYKVVHQFEELALVETFKRNEEDRIWDGIWAVEVLGIGTWMTLRDVEKRRASLTAIHLLCFPRNALAFPPPCFGLRSTHFSMHYMLSHCFFDLPEPGGKMHAVLRCRMSNMDGVGRPLTLEKGKIMMSRVYN